MTLAKDELREIDADMFSDELAGIPPYIWPDSRTLIGLKKYKSIPPFKSILWNASLIGGTVVGVTEETVQLLRQLLDEVELCRLKLVFLVYPACPTRKKHLVDLKALQEQYTDPDRLSRVEFKVLPVSCRYGEDYEGFELVPTILEAVDRRSGKTTLCIGSNANLGMNHSDLWSFNTVFHASDAHCESFRRWFQVLFSASGQLNDSTVNIPHLVPAKGDPEAGRAWAEFVGVYTDDEELGAQSVEIDPSTGEVVADSNGLPVEEWDGGETKLDSLAQKIQEVYANGYLVTVDETTRIKPLTIPVSASLLGQESERIIGAVKKKLAFSLKVLDATTTREIEKYRTVTDMLGLLSYSLSKGVHWIPEEAKPLLDEELDEKNKQAVEALSHHLGDGSVDGFISKNAHRYRQDLNSMYRDLGGEGEVPDDAFSTILDMIRKRLEKAMDGRITPLVTYNQISAPQLNESAPPKNWSQPFALLLASSRLSRKSLTDSYFPRNFSKRSFEQDDYSKAMDVFGDVILKRMDRLQADAELKDLAGIESGDCDPKEKCRRVWAIISGKPSQETG